MSDARIDPMVERGQRVELSKETGPIVFHFRPTRYALVADEDVQEWERMFAEYVGLAPNKEQFERGAGATISGSNGNWDDCDYW